MALPNENLVVLSTFFPFGPTRIALLVKYFGSARKVWTANRFDLLATGINRKLVDAFHAHRNTFDRDGFFANLAKLKVSFTTIGADDYPTNLAKLAHAPTTLYIRGKLKKRDEHAIAIVGSRKITSYGKEVTTRFAVELANRGFTIVSGLAFGVDRFAHEGTVGVGGRCIAVLASGIDEITPRSNEWLGKIILDAGGAILSEFPPATKVQKSFFPHRNRIISGLSRAVLVVEGAAQSGTLHTAKHAAEQGREVFAIPGQITSPLSAAPHYLIQNGARIAFSPKDIIEELGLQFTVDKEEVSKVLPDTALEEKVLAVFANGPLHLDEVVRITGLKIQDVSATLTIMEIKGMLYSVGGGEYKKN